MLGLEKRKSGEKKFDAETIHWEKMLCFESFGVVIGIRSNVESYVDKIEAMLPEILPTGWLSAQNAVVEHWFSIYKPTTRAKNAVFYKNQELLVTQKFEPENLDFLISHIRITIAEFAPRHVFIHSGVVVFKDLALLIPGKSFTGKTTLVAELIKRGCRYYSDEYAVIDDRGMVEPYPKKLSLRGILDAYRQVDIPAEELGGQIGVGKVPVGFILVTEYKENAKFKPREASVGEGIIALIANSVSIRRNPQFVLEVLTPIANRARVVKTKRGGADKFAVRLLKFLEDVTPKTESARI